MTKAGHIDTAMITGRSHRLFGSNGQDVALTRVLPGGCALGIVADGCGSRVPGAVPRRSRNEVGAWLLAQFAVAWLSARLQPASDLPALIAALPEAGTRYLATVTAAGVAGGPAERWRFIATHLLCTLVGFVVTPESALLFAQGDGFWAVDGIVQTLEEGNRPAYLAYNLLPGTASAALRTCLVDHRPVSLGVASDGWTTALLREATAPEQTMPLQRWVNLRARERGTFEDDAAIASWSVAR